MKRRRRLRGKVLAPVHPNAGITVAYRQRLMALIDAMHESTMFWLSDVYQVDPGLAQDAGGRPARLMRITPSQLARMIEVATGRNTEMRGSSRTKDVLIREGLVQPRKGSPSEYELTPDGQKVLADRLTAEGRTIESLSAMSRPFLAISAAGEPLPSEILTRAMAQLTARWNMQFSNAAPRLAEYFSTEVGERTAGSLSTILRDGGFTVRFQMTRPMQDALNATTQENVGLIKSIPQQYLAQVEGMVMRSVALGGDLGTLAQSIERQYGVTKRRAALIARDQNNKATAVMTRARFKQIGVKKAIWRHSAGGKEPRPTHVANSGKPFDIDKGWYDPAVKRFIQPGELINCKCVAAPYLEGFTV